MAFYWGSTLGSVTSYATSLSLLLFYFLAQPKHKLLFPFIYLGILFYVFAGFNFSDELERAYYTDFVRFMIIVVCSVEVLQRTSKKDIYLLLLVGAVSIIINAVAFPAANRFMSASYGRYSGFYINPNYAGAICIVGFALSYAMADKRLRLGGQLLFTLGGILTFSRTFIVIWLMINLVAIYRNKKNIYAPAIGAIALILVFAFSGRLALSTDRFSALTSIFSEGPVETSTITRDSRTETWATYADVIMDNPIFGNGYNKLRSKKYGIGVHNSYLMVLGEAGILPFLIIVGIYVYLLIKTLIYFNEYSEYFYLTAVIALSLTTGHGYFDIFFNIFITMFVYVKIRELDKEKKLKNLALKEDNSQ